MLQEVCLNFNIRFHRIVTSQHHILHILVVYISICETFLHLLLDTELLVPLSSNLEKNVDIDDFVGNFALHEKLF